MAMRIEEEDFGTKRATINKLNQISRDAPTKLDKMVFAFFKKVYMTALEEVPVDTGALRASIRLQKGEPSGKFVVGRGLENAESSYKIIAGGGGVINPKHRKEVDYARAVHDGHFAGGTGLVTIKGRKSKKRVGKGRWTPGRPFLSTAIQKNRAYLDQLVKEYMDDIEAEWVKDQPMPNIWKLPIRLRSPWDSMVF